MARLFTRYDGRAVNGVDWRLRRQGAVPERRRRAHGHAVGRRARAGYAQLVTARDVAISGDTIRLGQLLKLAGVVEGGGDVKGVLASGHVEVNGEPEARRGRQLHPGDTVRVGSEELRVVG